MYILCVICYMGKWNRQSLRLIFKYYIHATTLSFVRHLFEALDVKRMYFYMSANKRVIFVRTKLHTYINPLLFILPVFFCNDDSRMSQRTIGTMSSSDTPPNCQPIKTLRLFSVACGRLEGVQRRWLCSQKI